MKFSEKITCVCQIHPTLSFLNYTKLIGLLAYFPQFPTPNSKDMEIWREIEQKGYNLSFEGCEGERFQPWVFFRMLTLGYEIPLLPAKTKQTKTSKKPAQDKNQDLTSYLSHYTGLLRQITQQLKLIHICLEHHPAARKLSTAGGNGSNGYRQRKGVGKQAKSGEDMELKPSESSRLTSNTDTPWLPMYRVFYQVTRRTQIT